MKRSFASVMETLLEVSSGEEEMEAGEVEVEVGGAAEAELDGLLAEGVRAARAQSAHDRGALEAPRRAADPLVVVSSDEGEEAAAAETLFDPPSSPASPVEAGGVGVAEQLDPSSPPASPVGAGGVGVAEPPRSPASPAPT